MPRVLLDLEKVEIVTGAALGQIVSLFRHIRDRGGEFGSDGDSMRCSAMPTWLMR